MKIEHFALQVEDPAAVSDWYCRHLGFTVKRASDHPVCARFLADHKNESILEIYNNPKVKTPDYGSMDPLLMHLAFVCDEVSETAERLIRAGASLVSGPETTESGDELGMLRDPWGLAIQLCKRAKSLY